MGIESIVIVDTETTGLEPATCKIVEVAAVLYDVASACVIASFASLVASEDNAAEAINRIPVSALRNSPPDVHAWGRVGEIVDWATCGGDAVFMAHRASFDQSFLHAAAPGLAARLPWVCSKFDVAWPESKPGASCVELALAHGVPVVSAHRALTDCMLIANTLRAVASRGHDVGWLIAQALRPRVMLRALVSYDNREQAKTAGFAFNTNGDKAWTKRVACEDVATFAATLPFKVAEV